MVVLTATAAECAFGVIIIFFGILIGFFSAGNGKKPPRA